MVNTPSILELLKAGAHFGHQVSRWHPKMKPFIFGSRNNVHIIDLEKTEEQLKEAQKFIAQIRGKGGIILFLGTKKQVQKTLENEAIRCGMPYISKKWIGGFLTNFPIVIRLAKKYKDLLKLKERGELEKYTKKERMDFEKEIAKLQAAIGGVKDLEKIPEAIFIWDVKTEKTAIKEAKVRHIPIIGICDTNTNPEGIDYVIPVNDDASRTIALILPYIADCVLDSSNQQNEAK